MKDFEICLDHLIGEKRKVHIGDTWGDAFVWYPSDNNVIVIESRAAAQYLAYNRFFSPDVVRHYFKEIMRIMYQACDELKHRIFFPVYNGAKPLAEGLPQNVQQIPISCKRDDSSGEWVADGQIIKGLSFNFCPVSQEMSDASLNASLLDECMASSVSLRKSLYLALKYLISIAKSLLKQGIKKVNININIVGIWFSQIGIDRVRAYFDEILTEINTDERINIEPLGPFVLSMGFSELTEISEIYGKETGLPLDHPNTIVSSTFKPIARKTAQGKPLCAVGDVGLSIGNPKEKDKPSHEFEWFYGHRAEGFYEAQFFGIDVKQLPWSKEQPIIWNLEGNAIIPPFQQFLKETKPETYEQYAKIYGSNIESKQISVPIAIGT